MSTHFDVVIIGAGQAGIPLAHACASAGKTVAVAERKHLGGSCVNFGCTPSKAVLASARLAHQARSGATFGLRIPTVDVDFPAVLARARSLLLESRGSLRRGLENESRIALFSGQARLAGREGKRFRVRVGTSLLLANTVVLDTGTRAEIPRIPGLAELDYLHAGNWLNAPERPEHVVFLGAGDIALELGQFYRRMGSRVTLVERSTEILSAEDAETARTLRTLLESEGIDFAMESRVAAVKARARGVSVTLRSGRGPARVERELLASHVFVASGRRPNTGDLGLSSVGLRLGPDGIIPVDARLATRVGGIWAAGDIRGGAMYTSTAWDDYRVLASQLLGDGARTTERVVPYALFTDPELGRVGLTETQARASRKRIEVGRYEMRANGKARELGETNGFVKVIVEQGTGRILGATIVSHLAAELVHLVATLMNAGAAASVLADGLQVHPTLAEAVQSAIAAIGRKDETSAHGERHARSQVEQSIPVPRTPSGRGARAER
ncbi:MAG: FAD-dependent oxidoreductase [Thermoanaerobaculia bacterium]